MFKFLDVVDPNFPRPTPTNSDPKTTIIIVTSVVIVLVVAVLVTILIRKNLKK